jgi:hypothetical protein
MKKNRAQKDILYLSISSFALVVLWVGFNLYHAYVASTIAPDLQLQIVPIDPTFNSAAIQNIKQREKVAPVYQLTSSNDASSEATTPQTPATTGNPVSSQSGISIPSNSLPGVGQ